MNLKNFEVLVYCPFFIEIEPLVYGKKQFINVEPVKPKILKKKKGLLTLNSIENISIDRIKTEPNTSDYENSTQMSSALVVKTKNQKQLQNNSKIIKKELDLDSTNFNQNDIASKQRQQRKKMPDWAKRKTLVLHSTAQRRILTTLQYRRYFGKTKTPTIKNIFGNTGKSYSNRSCSPI